MNNNGQIKIIRTKNQYYRLRKIAILINGKKAGSIREGETVSYNLAPRIYEISAKIDWIKSKIIEIDIKENRIVQIHIGYENMRKWPLYALRTIMVSTCIVGLIVGNGILIGMGIVAYIVGGKSGKPLLNVVDS